jgi:sorbitol-specific phosphotransferase system component IIA
MLLLLIVGNEDEIGVTSSGIMFVQNFMKIGHLVQKFRGDTQAEL